MTGGAASDAQQIISWFDGLLPKASTYMAPPWRPFSLTTLDAMGARMRFAMSAAHMHQCPRQRSRSGGLHSPAWSSISTLCGGTRRSQSAQPRVMRSMRLTPACAGRGSWRSTPSWSRCAPGLRHPALTASRHLLLLTERSCWCLSRAPTACCWRSAAQCSTSAGGTTYAARSVAVRVIVTQALAILLFRNGSVRHALDMWKRFGGLAMNMSASWHGSIALGELSDASFEGPEFVIGCLQQVADVDVIYTHMAWLLKQSPRGVSVFTAKRGDEPSLFRPDVVLDFLRPFPEARQLYLEHLVFTLKACSRVPFITSDARAVRQREVPHGTGAAVPGRCAGQACGGEAISCRTREAVSEPICCANAQVDAQASRSQHPNARATGAGCGAGPTEDHAARIAGVQL